MCGCCFSKSIQRSHRCVERSMHANCPVCLEFMFDSIAPIAVMRCGHTIHERCLTSMFEYRQYTCPTCHRSACDMAAVWARMDIEIAETPMPEEYRSLTKSIICNDCGVKGLAPVHMLGMKCVSPTCGSYNTQQ
jgi:RING finger/CHY zinc finger protein 1